MLLYEKVLQYSLIKFNFKSFIFQKTLHNSIPWRRQGNRIIVPVGVGVSLRLFEIGVDWNLDFIIKILSHQDDSSGGY